MKRERSRIRYAVRLSGYIKGFGFRLFLATLCNMAFMLLPLLTSVTTTYLVSSVLLGQTEPVLRLLITAAVLVVLTAVFSYLDVQVSHDMAYRILTQLRDLCYDKLDELAPAALMGERSGDMISIILGDVETLEWFYAHTIIQLAVAVTVPVATLIFLGWLSPLLPLVILPFIAALVLIPAVSSRKADKQGTAVKETTGILNAVIVDGVQGIKDIISFRWIGEYMKRFFRVNSDYSEASIAYAKRRADESRLISLMTECASLATEITAVSLAASGKLSALWLMPVFVLSSAIFRPIMEALSMSTNYGLIFGAAKRVLELLNRKPATEDTGRDRFQRAEDTEVCFRHVSFTYPGVGTEQNPQVLRDLCFSFRTGETVALVGASGEGKTTAARLLQRFWDVDGGSITINGKDIRELTLDSLRETVTVVPQEVYLFNMSVEENLRLARLDAANEEIRAAAEQARARSFIDRLPMGWQTVVGEQGMRLSGGEKQRLSIAQAFLKDSPVLVLDEASANLDAENELLINEAVSHLKRGRATLVIAHRISTIRSADRIVMVSGGINIAEGTYEELLANCTAFRKLIGDEYEEDD